jgi:hypothetical protein
VHYYQFNIGFKAETLYRKKTYGSYEQAKLLWLAKHLDSTPEQYQIAMRKLAKKCGV